MPTSVVADVRAIAATRRNSVTVLLVPVLIICLLYHDRLGSGAFPLYVLAGVVAHKEQQNEAAGSTRYQKELPPKIIREGTFTAGRQRSIFERCVVRSSGCRVVGFIAQATLHNRNIVAATREHYCEGASPTSWETGGGRLESPIAE